MKNSQGGNNMSKIKIDDCVLFGSYTCDKDGSKSPVRWMALDIKDDKALLLSEQCLDFMTYNDMQNVVTWEDCTLRAYMNETLLHEIFTDDEIGLLLECDNANDENKFFYSKGGDPSLSGPATRDRLFLLSSNEVETYLKETDRIRARATEYARAKLKDPKNVFCSYWLRGVGMRGNLAIYVKPDGQIEYVGCHVNCADVGIRPALWVDLAAAGIDEYVSVASAKADDLSNAAAHHKETQESDTLKKGPSGIVLGVIGMGISLSVFALLFFIPVAKGLALFIPLLLAALLCGIFGVVRWIKSRKERPVCLVLPIVAIALTLFMASVIYYTQMSGIWQII